MRFLYIKPTGILSQYIRHYWILEADESEGEVSERVIPTGNIELMFHYKKPFIVKSKGEVREQPRVIISGISSNYSDVTTRGESGVIAVKFFPYGACNFFNFPLHEIENLSINLNDVYSGHIRLVEEQIQEAKTLNERIFIVEKFLLEFFTPVYNDDILFIKRGVSLINQYKGQINPTHLSSLLAITGKSLERKFSAFLGKTPKQFIKIIRFQEVIRSLSYTGKKSLTEVAYENGYYDQSHFIKDFKSLSGYTPGEFLGLGPCHSDYFE
jgi:AraC-like DNA-binding protein